MSLSLLYKPFTCNVQIIRFSSGAHCILQAWVLPIPDFH